MMIPSNLNTGIKPNGLSQGKALNSLASRYYSTEGGGEDRVAGKVESMLDRVEISVSAKSRMRVEVTQRENPDTPAKVEAEPAPADNSTPSAPAAPAAPVIEEVPTPPLIEVEELSVAQPEVEDTGASGQSRGGGFGFSLFGGLGGGLGSVLNGVVDVVDDVVDVVDDVVDDVVVVVDDVVEVVDDVVDEVEDLVEGILGVDLQGGVDLGAVVDPVLDELQAPIENLSPLLSPEDLSFTSPASDEEEPYASAPPEAVSSHLYETTVIRDHLLSSTRKEGEDSFLAATRNSDLIRDQLMKDATDDSELLTGVKSEPQEQKEASPSAGTSENPVELASS